MEIEIYRKRVRGADKKLEIYENDYYTKIPLKESKKDYLEMKNIDPHCLGLAIAHTIEKVHKNKLESLILKKGEGIEDMEIETIAKEIENSGSNTQEKGGKYEVRR